MTSKLTLVVGLALLTASPIYATSKLVASSRQHHPDSTQLLDDVVVSADMRRPSTSTRSQVPLSKLPLSISKVHVQSLLNQGLISVPEALRFVPAASMHTSYGAFLQLQVRGFDHTPIIIDGMRDERSTINSYPLSDLSDVESIEVLKGPASVLQGHSSEGGLLSITRRRATAKPSFYTRTELGSWSHFYNATRLNGRISEHLNALAGLSYKTGDGWRHTGDKRFKVYGTLSGNWAKDVLDLRISYNNDFYGTDTGLAPIVSNDVYKVADNKLFLPKRHVQDRIARDARYNSQSDEMWHRNFNSMLKWTHTFSPQLRLTEQASYNDDLIDYFSTEELAYPTKAIELNALPQEAPYPYYYDSGDKRTYIDLDHVSFPFPLRFAHRSKMLQNQLGLDGYFYTGDIKHNFALGYDLTTMWRTSFTGYNDEDVVGPGKTALVSVVEPRSMGYMTHQLSQASPNKTIDHGWYAQDVVELLDNLQAMLALRYDTYRYYTTAKVETQGGTMDYTYPYAEDFSYVSSSALTYRLGLVYSPTKATTLYASLANIFKPERESIDKRYTYINSQGEVFEPSVNGEVFKPRTGYQVEVGLRSKIGHMLQGDVSAYYIKVNNQVKGFNQTAVDPATGLSSLKRYRAQIGSIVSAGFEASLIFKPVHGLSLTAGYSLTDARYGKIAENALIKEDVATGQRLNYVPRHQVFSLGSYHLGAKYSGAELHYSFSYTDERKTSGTVPLEGYCMLDLGGSIRLFRGLRVGIDIYNVLNTDVYYSSLNGVQAFPIAPTNGKLHISYTL